MQLIKHIEKELWRGTILRFKGQYPFEEIVDFMLICYPSCESGFALTCISGYCAGNLELCLPEEAVNDFNSSISTQWVIDNWNKWIYDGCTINDVWFIENTVPTSFE